MSEAKGIIKHIPNFITCLNILSGSLAIILALDGHTYYAAILIILAAIFDFFDGFAARLLKAYSPMGKELDSLADMLSFGFAPAAISYSLLRASIIGDPAADIFILDISISDTILMLMALITPVFSGLRLAKFNVDTRQTSSFIGIPTPANAMFWASWPIIFHFGEYQFARELLANHYFIISAIIITSLLLVAEIPMFALKVKNASWADNKIRYIFIATLIVLTVLIKWLVIPSIIIIYILFSIVNNILSK